MSSQYSDPPATPRPFWSAHALRHDALTACAARTLREVERAPGDWLEGPRARRAERLRPEPAPPLARLARGVVAGVVAVAVLGAVVMGGLWP